MYLTEKEIFSQYEALKKTYEYFISKMEDIKGFIKKYNPGSFTFIGAGSGYCLCQSAEISSKMRLGIPANSFAAGDLMVNFAHYKEIMSDTLLIVPSRSGSTTEVIMAVEKAKKEFNTPCISISAVKDSQLSRIADLSLEIPWAFDESVCQTRNVSNLYTANLMLIGILSGNDLLLKDIKNAIDSGEAYMERYTQLLKDISFNSQWEKVMVLADSELQGIANEGAIAFIEIAQINSNYNHVLDVRHGPAVLINEKTLVIMAVNQFGESYQRDLIEDIKSRGAVVITVSSEAVNNWGSDYNIVVPEYKNFAVVGIPFINVAQIIAYYKALERNINPDAPNGLDPWIKLDKLA